MTRRLALLSLLLLPSAACGDECDEGYVDTFGFCTTDGEVYMLADAVAGALIHLAPDVTAGAPANCPDGGTTTLSEPALCHPDCQSTWTFADCQLDHDTASRLPIRLSGTIDDHNTTVIGSPTIFTHVVTGQIEVAATVRLKGERRREIGPKSCTLDFSYVQIVAGDTTITGSICDQEVRPPLYVLGR